MLCAVYKSASSSFTYLFIKKRDDFNDVPDALLKTFGVKQLVSVLNITADTKFAIGDAKKIIDELTTTGYYLQLPPPPIDHLKEHRKWQSKTKYSKEQQ